MKGALLILLIPILILAGCASAPEPETPPPAETAPAEPIAAVESVPVEEPKEQAFDPGSITQEVFDTTLAEVQKLVSDLDGILKSKNYRAWASHVGESYLTMISSAEFLTQTSESDVLKKAKIRLRTPQDYFNWVVVPSHSKDRVDTIEFISQERVKVYMVNEKGQQLRIWDLERSGKEWKITS
jgi:hypothetical protein